MSSSIVPSSSSSLAALGWDDHFAAELPGDLLPARVSRVDRGAAEVLTATGPVRAHYGARVRREAAADPVALPCVGDWVGLRRLAEGRYELEALAPRRTAFVRGGVARVSRGGLSGDSQGQVLAANVDVVFVAEPALHATDTADLGRIERLLALAWESGAQPVVLVTKADLVKESLEFLMGEVAAVAPGVDAHAISSLRGEGVDVVQGYLRGARTAVVLGASGAGKSTLVNALAGVEVMETQQVRAGDGRGRHTTVHRELIVLAGGGLVIDTPGIRRIGLYDMNDGVDMVFADLEELAERCRFADCRHDGEPGCAVLAAIEDGTLPERRLESWRKLQREAAWIASRSDARLRKEMQNKWKIIHKEMRKAGRNRP
ncbi:ribosome biogenesis GTPase [Streptosporangium becharense]|uniref:Small ribosomal subunit biogenesis GTPase RsgA n=1 Tax=Streptosporangium becharense TaxID=1816182 RepID=A0A7W9IKI4_9ACTN|nr:ribosome small subunit-dependent GTPase A [Streptosporangium becharense]MBB2911758.1 ribosome biogenesis GTPase [Streptosporangium becharense]MBB5822424.1 ribosome biogenesis GTPase [Streptosporangium becharense]